MAIRMYGEESRLSPTTTGPSPSPVPARESFGKAGLTQRALSKPCGAPPRSPALPKGQLPLAALREDRYGYGRKPSKAKGQRTESQDEALNRYSRRPRDSREEELRGSLARTANASPCPSRPTPPKADQPPALRIPRDPSKHGIGK